MPVRMLADPARAVADISRGFDGGGRYLEVQGASTAPGSAGDRRCAQVMPEPTSRREQGSDVPPEHRGPEPQRGGTRRPAIASVDDFLGDFGLSPVTLGERPALAVVAPSGELGLRILQALRDEDLDPALVVSRVDDVLDAAPAVLVVSDRRGARARDELLWRLSRRLPKTRVVLVAERQPRMSVRAAVDAGVDGLVFEDELERTLVPTIRATIVGQTCVPRDRRREIDRPTLSAREREVLDRLVMGLSNQEIAHQLYLAESTVKTHLSTIFRKLGVRNRNEATALVLERREEHAPALDPPAERGS
jgi:DNA-binding NarL/FixJ family response regulator